MQKIRYMIIALLCAVVQGVWAWDGSGTEADPYQISTTADWNQLATDVNAGTPYAGTYFMLTTDISVTTMVGKGTNRFQGRFDGDGKTITFNVTATEDYCAPFCRISGATIKNLKTAGTIETDYRYAAGIVAYSRYYSRIENCRSNVTIKSSHAGWGGHGGILGLKAEVSYSKPTIEGCLFDGKILTTGETATTGCGGIVGFTNGQTLTLRNCVYKPAALETGETAVECSSLYENSGRIPTTVTCENCYYFESLGAAQGKQARSISAGNDVTVAMAVGGDLQSPTEYSVSGITAYGAGISLTPQPPLQGEEGENLYAGKGDDVSLTLGNTLTGVTVVGYTATAGTLTANSPSGDGGASYTLSMPDQRVTINVTVSDTPQPTNLNIDYMGGTTATVTWEGSASKYNIYINGTTINNVSSPYEFTVTMNTGYTVMVQSVYGSSTSDWTDAVTLQTPLCTIDETCELVFELHDVDGDGWNGNAIIVEDVETGVVLATITIDKGYDKTVSIYACKGRTINFVWNNGKYAYETSYTVKYTDGTVILSDKEGNGMIENYTVDCEAGCPRPRNLTVDYTPGYHTATVSWEGPSDTYNIDVNGSMINKATSPYVLTGLALATTYNVKVQSNCTNGSTGDWSETVTFSTSPCEAEDMCELTFELHDDDVDGWNGAAIQVVDAATNIVLGTATMDDGESEDVTVKVCNGRTVNFVWVKGNWDKETSYVVKDKVGDVIFSGSKGNGMITGYTVDCSSTCRRPTDLAVSDVGSYTATLSWTENGEATEWKICLNGDEENLITVNNSQFSNLNSQISYTFTGLSAETSYTVKVSPNSCGALKWSDAFTFSTDVSCHTPTYVTASNVTKTAATIGWTSDNDNFKLRYVPRPTTSPISGNYATGETHTYDFEDHTMQGWTNIDADGDGHTWVVGSKFYDDPDDSSDFVISQSYFNHQPLTPDNYLVSPQVMLGGSISFYAKAQDEDYPDEHFGVAVSTTGNTNAADFTTIAEWTMDANGGTGAVSQADGWGLYTVDLNAYEGQLGYVAIRHFDCSDVYILNVDDITIVEGGGSLEWNVVSDKISNPSYTLSGLKSGTNYYVQVQSDCGGTDGSSYWSKLMDFTTLTATSAPHELNATDITATTAKLNWVGAQSSYNVRYGTAVIDNFLTEGFEGGTMPDGWTRTGSYWTVTSGTGSESYKGAATGSYNAACYGSGRDFSDILITPAMDLSGAESVTLSFNLWNTNWEGYVNTLKVYFRVDGGDDWHLLYSYYLATDGWTPVTVPLEGMAANYQIGFECSGDWGRGIGIDDVVVKSEPYVNNWTTVSNVTSPLALTGLTPETQYLWQVQGINDGVGGDLQSPTAWSEEAAFTTDYADLTLYDTADNTSVLTNSTGHRVNATISGRTLYKDGKWNTLCLPFDVTATQIAIADHPLYGATIMELDVDGKYNGSGILDNENGTYQTGFDDGTLYLYFKDATKIKAGVPYIVKWGGNSSFTSPTFTSSEIEGGSPRTVTSDDGYVSFVGNYDPVNIGASGDNTKLYLGSGNTLYWPSGSRSINAFRAYFQLNDIEAGEPNSTDPNTPLVRAFVLNFGEEGETTGIISTTNFTDYTDKAGAGWYDLQGRKLSGKPTEKGIYIYNGKKRVIK